MNKKLLMFQQKKKYKNIFSYFFHKKSTTKIDNSNEIFGIPLADATNIGTILWELKVPDPVALCFKEISKRGLITEGIFRLSGSKMEVELLEKKINSCKNEERKLLDLSKSDIHTLSSLVKKYIRELPDPVIPYEYHQDFLSTNRNLDLISNIILKLPYYNRQLLHSILIMTNKVQQHVDVNMMSPEALATVFAPICTGFEKSLNFNYTKHSIQFIDQYIQKNKNWTDIWRYMIEQSETLIALLDKNLITYRSLPSPFSTANFPLPNEIIMAQFYPIQDTTIPIVAHPTHDTTKKPIASSFFQKSNSLRKILSASTLR